MNSTDAGPDARPAPRSAPGSAAGSEAGSAAGSDARGDDGSGAVLEQPWLHDLTIVVDGNGTALSDRTGDMLGTGAHGFFVDDERVVSRLSVRAEGSPLTLVRGTNHADTAGFLLSARRLGNPGPDPTVELHRTRVVAGPTLTETFSLASRADAPVHTDLVVTLASDGASLHDVKTGRPEGTLLDVDVATGAEASRADVAVAAQVSRADASWATSRLRVRVEVSPEPSALAVHAGELVARVPVTVEPGDSAQVTVTVRAERLAPSAFDADSGSDAVDWSDVRVTADDVRLGRLVDRSVRDLKHLLMRDPADRDDIFAAAGTPWYLTLFGRDSIWAARMVLPLGTELAGGTLRALARRQGTVHDPESAEAPGRIPHELRRTTFEGTEHDLVLPTTYYGTVDATALWVCLLHDAWRWGLPEAQVRALLPALRSALEWILGHSSPDDDGLVKYIDTSGHGLANQGWKDSGDSMRFRDGSLATAPISLVEAQAYTVEACHAAGHLLRALGEADETLLHRLDQRADELTGLVRSRFWVTDPAGGQPWLAMAVDGRGRQVDGIGSNMGHVLGTGCLSADEAERVADRLMSPEMLSPYGIRTMSTDTAGYNPIGYHTGTVWTHDAAICAHGLAREGHSDAASEVSRRLLAAAEQFGYAMPELFSEDGPLGAPAPYPASCRPQAWACAAPIALLSAVLGLDADVPARRLTLRPSPERPFGAMRVEGLRVGGRPIVVTLGADGVVDVDGLPEGWTVTGGEDAE